MKHYKLVQLYNAPINTSYQVFDIIPTLRERKNSAPVLNGTSLLKTITLNLSLLVSNSCKFVDTRDVMIA